MPLQSWLAALRIHGRWMLAALAASTVGVFIGYQSNTLWVPLSSSSIYLSAHLLRLVFSDVIVDPDHLVIGTPKFRVAVLGGCSGYEGIGLMLGLMSVYLWFRRRELRFPAALSLLPLGMTIIFLCNAVRLAVLVMLGTLVSKDVAMRGFHSQAGWISLTGLSILLITAVERLGWFRLERKARGARYPALPFIVPLVSLLFALMVTQAFSIGFDVWYPLRIIAVAAVLVAVRRTWLPLMQRPSAWAVGVGLLVYVLWIALVPGHVDSSGDPASHLTGGWAQFWIAWRILGAVVIIPLTEELAFRGFLLRRLQQRQFEEVPMGQLTPLAVLGSSLAFGLLHQQWLAGLLAGLAYAGVTRLRGNLADAVVAHGVTNLCLALQVLLLQQWSLWS